MCVGTCSVQRSIPGLCGSIDLRLDRLQIERGLFYSNLVYGGLGFFGATAVYSRYHSLPDSGIRIWRTENSLGQAARERTEPAACHRIC